MTARATRQVTSILRAMSRAALCLLVSLASAASLGCDKPSDGGSPSSSAAKAASPAPTQTASAAEPAPPPPDDLKVAELQKALKCPAEPKSGPCKVLVAFAACKEWNAVSPAGDARYLGRAFIVEGAKTTEQITVVRSKRVPTSEIAAGQLPVKIAITDIPKEEGAAFDQAERAIRAFERNDVPPRSNPTLEYIKKRSEWSDAHASRTVSGQVFVSTAGGAYLCQGPRQQLVVVQRSGRVGADGDGLFAELWATTW